MRYKVNYVLYCIKYGKMYSTWYIHDSSCHQKTCKVKHP
jgi:hypothetical protein